MDQKGNIKIPPLLDPISLPNNLTAFLIDFNTTGTVSERCIIPALVAKDCKCNSEFSDSDYFLTS